VSLLSRLQSGVRIYDRRMNRERLVQAVESRGQVVFLSLKHPQTSAIDRQPFSLIELEDRFEILSAETMAFRADPDIVSLVAEAHRLEHAYLFNPLFATETSLIDLLPHQLAAVCSSSSSGCGLRLARRNARTRGDLGEPHASGRLPIVDALRRLMHLWSAGNLNALNAYAAEKGLRHNDLFWEVAQAVLEMAAPKSRERTLLEAVVAWGRGKVAEAEAVQQERLL
jgi:hypothetical protein